MNMDGPNARRLSWLPLASSSSDETEALSHSVHEEPAVAQNAAKYVRGNVGLDCGGGRRKFGLLKLRRPGTIVVNLGDGGSVSFYDAAAADNGRKRTERRDGGQQTRLSFRRLTSVRADTEEFEEPDEGPCLHIPQSVPWQFKVVSRSSFQIVVPPFMGRTDYRVEHSMPRKATSSASVTNVLGENSQVFLFRCEHPRELAVWTKAAQTLDRNLAGSGLRTKTFNLFQSTKTVRKRTAEGMEILAQSALIRGVFDDGDDAAVVRLDSIGEQEHRCYPLHAYPNTWLTARDIAAEVVRRSAKYHDLCRGAPGEVGTLKIEVLECLDLPKLDRFGNTDAYCYIVCESSSFVTDVIPDTTDPVWLPLSRRACIMPVQRAYSQVFVGVFDYDGEREADDFAGRVVIDIPQLRSGCQYDVVLPLRQTSHVYRRDKKCGFVRLRLELNWKSEKAALLTYLPKSMADVTKRIEAPVDPITVECPDAKSFHNVALTVYGKDTPGRYTNSMKTAVTLEVRLIQKMMLHHAKRMAFDVVSWKNPLLSAYFFVAWMYITITGSNRHAAAFVLSLAFLLLLKNYVRYNMSSAKGSLHGHKTLGGMARILLLGHDDSKENKALDQKGNASIVDKVLLLMFGEPPAEMSARDSWRYQEHAEFPWSSGAVYHKMVANDESASSEDGPSLEVLDDSESERSRNNAEPDDELCGDDDAEERLTALEKARSLVAKGKKRGAKKEASTIVLQSSIDELEHTNKFPHQDINYRAKSDPILQQMGRQHGKAQRYSLHLFDDRVFITEDRADAERVLRINTTSNPIAKKLNPILATAVKIFSIGLSSFRAVFNVFMWKDPNLSFYFLVLLSCLMVFTLVFPWRLFFLVVGLVGLGPQNKLLIKWHLDERERRRQQEALNALEPSPRVDSNEARENPSQDEGPPSSNKPATRSARLAGLARRRTLSYDRPDPELKSLKAPEGEDENDGRVDLSNSPLLLRNNVQMKPDGKNRSIIVPSLPFRYNRFYDWPPDPASSTIKHTTEN